MLVMHIFEASCRPHVQFPTRRHRSSTVDMPEDFGSSLMFPLYLLGYALVRLGATSENNDQHYFCEKTWIILYM